MNRKTRTDLSLVALLAVSFAFLFRVEHFLRRNTQEVKDEGVSEIDKTIQPGWDKVAFNEVMKLFIPKWQEEILEQERIIEKEKSNPEKIIDAYVKMSEIYEKQGKYDKAEDACSSALKEYPTHPSRKKVYLRLSVVYEKEKKLNEAKEINKRFMDEFPDDSEVVQTQLKNITIYEQEGKYKEAIEGYKEFVKKYPNTKEKDHIAFRIGLLYQTIGEPDKAAEFYKGTTWDESSIWADNARGELWLKTRTGGLSKKLITAHRVETPPRIDGHLTDPVWEKGDKVTGFVEYKDNVPVSQQTVVSALYDEDNLYIAFNCLESKTYALVARCNAHDGNVWGDDSIEVFLDISRDYSTYYHMIVNPVGTIYEALKIEPTAWNPRLKVATAIGPNHWNVEIAIPFSALATETPRSGTAWGANFNRARRAGDTEISGWTFVDGSNHRPERFGYMVFE